MVNATKNGPACAEALQLAGRAVAGYLPDITDGADSYFSVSIDAPEWTAKAIKIMEIDWQRFYRAM